MSNPTTSLSSSLVSCKSLESVDGKRSTHVFDPDAWLNGNPGADVEANG
jgi:hypothetical protein